ncbi:RraA family protein [Streptomyces luomodiensis]|uniref:Putative 4-hydroxy-4-methyl-2-oxoglutarate aldolase n=1 Tax=Streptomyces luomodiensis TaxID=3026192 RepID=A0ABY9V946_9ACTN|nr:4-carboxy-4-hydroxy-2-oxoadipate aldolase/oxaloacetate decarboxylase [Streptomyces sp. SCA4-21]WNF01142.1 RraA family protein [Streptomyces sp. SCA4-21]
MNDILERLRAVDTCAVSDALDRHGVRGVVTGLRSLAADRPFAGRAVTVRLGPPAEGGTLPKRHLGTAAVDASGPGQVIVVDHQGRTDCAGWGGLLSRAAASRGIEGVIVDGAARDLAEAAEVGFPVHARTSTPVTARARAVEHAWGEPVTLDGLEVMPGDLVLADSGGVVVVPADRAEEIIATAERVAATEAAMAQAIDGGTPVSDVMGKTYEELTDADH